MDTKDELNLSFMVDEEDNVRKEVAFKMEESPSNEEATLKSNLSVTFSEGSSSLQLSDNGETPGNLNDGVDEQGHQMGHEDADDELSDDDVSAAEASVSDSASNGTTSTPSGDTYQHGKSFQCDISTTMSCCFRFGRFLGFWLLVAGTIIVGKEMVEYASLQEAEQTEEEVRASRSELTIGCHRHQNLRVLPLTLAFFLPSASVLRSGFRAHSHRPASPTSRT